MKTAEVETYLVKPRRLFLEIHTDEGRGTELDRNALADKIDHDWQNPRICQSDDGSEIDW